MIRTIADVLNPHLTKFGWSFEKLAKEAGLPRNTVYRWIRGEVRKVRHWQDLISAARVLDLNRSETNALLSASGHASIDVLLERATTETDRDLLSRWFVTATNNLPAQLTSFVGRREELEQLTQLLSSTRLVTLTGPGGSGKTRLAIEVAQATLDEFEEVYFIDLSTVRDVQLVIPTISRTLGLGETLDEPPHLTLMTHLRDRKVLLLLDNLEQVVGAAPLLAEILWTASEVKMLVTSRKRLNVRGEHEFEVLPLSVPEPASGFDELMNNPAIALFSDRAIAVNPSYTLTSRNAGLVAMICAHLDGLPLAIELAAARTRQVKLGSMLERFPARLALASQGPQDVSERQRALRAAIAWSYDLLECNEQHLLNVISVFAGGFTEEAAVLVWSRIGQPDIEVSESLETLVEHNLVRRVWDTTDEPRYELLETIREYALEQLVLSGKSDAASSAACDYFADLADKADVEGRGQATWLPRLAVEHYNFQTALTWCRERGQIETGLKLSIALMPWWQLRDLGMEARAWLDAFMAVADEVSPKLRARGLLWQGLLLMRRTGDDVSASRLFEEALALFRNIGDLDGASETLQAEGDAYRKQGELQRASERYAESQELARRTENAYLVAHGYLGLALCAQEEGKFDAAKHNWSMMLEWAENAGNTASIALALNSLGEMARYREDWEEAERYYEQTLKLARDMEYESRIALALHNLGYVALSGGETERAGRLFADGLLLYEKRHHLQGIAECLAGLGKAEAAEGRLEKAARLCGATESILENMGSQLDTLDRAEYERTLGMLKNRLGERLGSLLDEGRSMPMERAVEQAVVGHRVKS